MYATSTFALRMPANRDTATIITGTGAPAATTSDTPMPTAPHRQHHPADRLGREAGRDHRARQRPDREGGQHEPHDPFAEAAVDR